MPPEPGLVPGASLERSPGHPSIPTGCRFPWKLMRSRILLRGLPEEILEGPSYNAALPVPEGLPSTEKAPQADGTVRPQGDAVLPCSTSLSSPPGARFPPGCWPAAPLRIKNTNIQQEQRVDQPGPHRRQRHAARRRRCCCTGCSSTCPSPPMLVPLFLLLVPSHLGQCHLDVTKMPPALPQAAFLLLAGPACAGRPGGSGSRPSAACTAVTRSARGSRVIVPGCFPAGRPRGQLAAAGLEQRGLF